MKRKNKVLVMSSLLVLFVAIASLLVYELNVPVEEKTVGTITYKLRKDVLTISGEGEIPKNMIFSENKEIKKVIIEEGITRIPKKAFYECENLKKVKISNTVEKIGKHCFEGTKIKKITIPESVKVIGGKAIAYCSELKEVTMPGNFEQAGNSWTTNIMVGSNNIETVNFNTDFDVETADRCAGRKWNVREEDPNYKSIGGVIYTKDGKEIVRVPKDLEVLDVAEGCEIFNFESIYYLSVEECSGNEAHCDELKKLILPKSVKQIKVANYLKHLIDSNLQEVTIKAEDLDTENIITLISCLKQVYKYGMDGNVYPLDNMDIVAEAFPNKIKKDGYFYVIDKNILLGYEGEEETVTVPQYIKRIADKALFAKKVKKVNLPEGLEEIGNKAFSKCKLLEEINLPESLKKVGKKAFRSAGIKKIVIPSSEIEWDERVFEKSKLVEVVLPNDMAIISKYLFSRVYRLKTVNVPHNLVKIEEQAFYGTKVDIQSFLDCKNLRTIEYSAFGYVEWKNLIIPKYIESIDPYAFATYDDKLQKITIESEQFKHRNNTFLLYSNVIELTFKTDPDFYFTEVDISSERFCEDPDFNPTEIKWFKVNDVDGYDIVISSNKKFTENMQKYTAKNDQTNITVDLDRRWDKVYIKIRPYKMINGKKICGKWTKDKDVVC